MIISPILFKISGSNIEETTITYHIRNLSQNTHINLVWHAVNADTAGEHVSDWNQHLQILKVAVSVSDEKVASSHPYLFVPIIYLFHLILFYLYEILSTWGTLASDQCWALYEKRQNCVQCSSWLVSAPSVLVISDLGLRHASWLFLLPWRSEVGQHDTCIPEASKTVYIYQSADLWNCSKFVILYFHLCVWHQWH